MSRLHFGQLGLFVSMQYIPLVVLFVLKGIQTARWHFAMAAGVITAIIGWQSLNIGSEAALYALFLLLIFGYKKLSFKELFAQSIILGLVTGLLMVPVIYPLIRDYPAFKDQMNWSVFAASNDLLNFVMPDRSISTFWRTILGNISNQPLTDYYQLHGQTTTFIGWGVILLTAISIIILPPKKLWRWWLAAGLFLLLCIGPVIYFNGKAVMPNLFYSLVSFTPFLRLFREPSRWGIFLILSLSISIGYLCAKLGGWSRWLQGVLICSGLVIYAEFVASPIILNDAFEKSSFLSKTG